MLGQGEERGQVSALHGLGEFANVSLAGRTLGSQGCGWPAGTGPGEEEEARQGGITDSRASLEMIPSTLGSRSLPRKEGDTNHTVERLAGGIKGTPLNHPRGFLKLQGAQVKPQWGPGLR